MSAKKAGKSFDLHARVFAKVRGFPAWPARVQSVTGSGASAKYGVFFYGTYESATLKAADIWPFDEASTKRFGKNKAKNFDVAMKEIQENPNIKTAEMLMEEAQETQGIEGGAGADADAAVAAEGSQPMETETETQAASEDSADGEGEGALQIAEVEPKSAKATPKTPARGNKKAAAAATPATTTPASARGTKRKAPPPADDGDNGELSTPTATPAAKVAKQSSTPLQTPTDAATPSSENRTSRSGRVIKQKKFADEVAEEAKVTR